MMSERQISTMVHTVLPSRSTLQEVRLVFTGEIDSDTRVLYHQAKGQFGYLSKNGESEWIATQEFKTSSRVEYLFRRQAKATSR